MSEYVKLAIDGAVANITLDRAGGNRLTNEMALALAAALDATREARVIVLRATGEDFCLGRDMPPPAPGAGVSAMDVLRDDAGPITALYDAFRRCRQPVVCLINGKAWGIGMVLAGVADLTLASEGGSFRLRELERGIPPCIAMAPLLDRMPVKALAYLVLAADEMDAQAALQAGVVSRVVKAGQLEAVGQALVERLLSFPDEAVQAVKQYLASAPRNNEPNAIMYGASLLGNVLGSR